MKQYYNTEHDLVCALAYMAKTAAWIIASTHPKLSKAITEQAEEVLKLTAYEVMTREVSMSNHYGIHEILRWQARQANVFDHSNDTVVVTRKLLVDAASEIERLLKANEELITIPWTVTHFPSGRRWQQNRDGTLTEIGGEHGPATK